MPAPGHDGVEPRLPAWPRHPSIDATRGVAMVIMALDHVRDFVHADAMAPQAAALMAASPLVFLTRWVTHVCAPTFVLLAGMAASRRVRRDGATASVAAYLALRGMLLIVVELTMVRFAFNFRFSGTDPVMLLVLWAIGLSMIALAPMIWLPSAFVGAAGLCIVLFHNTVDTVRAACLGAWAPVWMVLHEPGILTVAGQLVLVAYPALPWFGLVAVGYALGDLFDLEPRTRRRLLARTGLALVLAFFVLRWWNGYGDPVSWSTRGTAVATALAFLGTTKYPPSLMFLLMTVGPALLALAWFERAALSPRHPLAVLGRTALFYYVGHFVLAHTIASCLAWWRYDSVAIAFLSGPFPSMGGSRGAFPPDFGWPLWTVYATWLGVVVLMYPACAWFEKVKRDGRWNRLTVLLLGRP